jgi:hypothetical protein
LEVYDNLELNSVIEIPYEYMNDLGETIDLVSGFRKIGVARRLVGFMRQFVVISLTGYPVIFNELSKQHYNELFLKISEAGCKRKFSHEFLISKFRELMKILPHRGSISMRDIVPARFGFFFVRGLNWSDYDIPVSGNISFQLIGDYVAFIGIELFGEIVHEYSVICHSKFKASISFTTMALIFGIPLNFQFYWSAKTEGMYPQLIVRIVCNKDREKGRSFPLSFATY